MRSGVATEVDHGGVLQIHRLETVVVLEDGLLNHPLVAGPGAQEHPHVVGEAHRVLAGARHVQEIAGVLPPVLEREQAAIEHGRRQLLYVDQVLNEHQVV